ncbi:hypothetical protein [Spirosoma radiotolerans]|uniref:Uncharacterized protein n=1 Tax=Spirosoma radiotolerans TaxID=1379870 RepID=A0A0E3ZVC6_9BACT|nr:hypothetical protein [Spirosoma radiotolerans]AKD55029.1 hypothetical protein SD10_09050 [Spirosoma radiotolerans]
MIADHATQKIIGLNDARRVYEETKEIKTVEVQVLKGGNSQTFVYRYDPESDSLIPEDSHLK